jgi:hypothetical protein
MATSITKGGTQKLPKNLRLLKHTDMTIHWEALEHLLVVPFFGENAFSEFTPKPHSLTFSPPIPGTPVRLVHHKFPVDRADDLLNFPLL